MREVAFGNLKIKLKLSISLTPNNTLLLSLFRRIYKLPLKEAYNGVDP